MKIIVLLILSCFSVASFAQNQETAVFEHSWWQWVEAADISDKRMNEVYFNEINTIPGSLSFYLWKYNNLDYTKQLDELIKISMKVHKRMNEFNYVFNNNLFTSNALNMKGKLKG